jgi:hypothetical protein
MAAVGDEAAVTPPPLAHAVNSITANMAEMPRIACIVSPQMQKG